MLFRCHRQLLAPLALATIALASNGRDLLAHANVMRRGAFDSDNLNLTMGANVSISDTSNNADNLIVGYFPQRLAEFSVEEIALGFINALKLQGLEDAAELQATYEFEDTEYADGKIKIRMDAVRGAPRAVTLRSSIMHALAVLSVTLIGDEFLAGVNFYLNYRHGQRRQRRLYNGVLDSINSAPTLELGNSSTNAALTSQKRSSQSYQLSVQDVNATTVLLTVPGADQPQLEVLFYLIGLPLTKEGLFFTDIMMVYGMGLNDASDDIGAAEMSENDYPVWIFVRKRPATTFPLATYHVLALLEGIARYSVQQGSYKELVYDLFADGELVSGGCVTRPLQGRKWCAGLRGVGMQGIEEGDFSAYHAP